MNIEDICATGPTVYSPYPTRLESLTICRWNYKGSTFSSVILRSWVLIRPELNSRPPAWQPDAQSRYSCSRHELPAIHLDGLLLRVEDAHDVTKALGVFRDLEFWLGIVSRVLFYCFTSCVSSTRSKSPWMSFISFPWEKKTSSNKSLHFTLILPCSCKVSIFLLTETVFFLNSL